MPSLFLLAHAFICKQQHIPEGGAKKNYSNSKCYKADIDKLKKYLTYTVTFQINTG